jgi:lipopolysaccharide/colanic/teichoic acid biosynthesis glycosyltransferase
MAAAAPCARAHPARMRGKRLLDLALLAPAAPLYAAVAALLALAVRVVDGRPVFFVQERVGQGGHRFRIWKLRTMTSEPDPTRRRPTRLGAWMRQRGLDEIPQLFNVLRGDMSLVGPRPLTPGDAERLTAQYPPFAARFAVPPGLTGLAQVANATGVVGAGVLATTALDTEYIRRRGALLDVHILARTVWINCVGKRRGAAAI